MSRLVVGLDEIEQADVALVGGKTAHLSALAGLEGITVPPGFCVTTEAFKRTVAAAPALRERIGALSRLAPDDRKAIGTLSEEIRRAFEDAAIPDDMGATITRALDRLGGHTAWAVRSSASAEDLPTASFAGQHDTFLNVVGSAAILRHIRRCWASLFTERAVSYRNRNGLDHRQVHMAVVVQQMVFSDAAGVLFTADPVTSSRKVASVEATYGLGEPLVSGQVAADVTKVRGGEIVARQVAAKTWAIRADPAGGTQRRAVASVLQQQAALDDGQILRLDQLGRRIEAHFGCPQDIEWCLVDDDFVIVQSRPITTLFPIPAAGDQENHVYVSVGHGQMMTDAMRPLGLSLWRLTTRAPMVEAGGRLFVDVTRGLSSPASRAGLLEVFGRGDPLVRDALQTLFDRGDFVPEHTEGATGGPPAGAAPAGGAPEPVETDPAVVTELIRASQDSIAAAKRDIAAKSGPELLDFILADIEELKRILFDPQSHRAIMAGMEATWWLNDHLQAWLDERNAADTLVRSAPHNVTSEMGLALLDVADAIRPHPDVVAALERVAVQQADDGGFLDELTELDGGRQAHDAIVAWLGVYGMRCPGEIDITRPRWSERPGALVPLILGNVRSFVQGESRRRFEQGRREASKKEQELLDRVRALPDGEHKVAETRQMIERVRTFSGYREYPKYGMVSRYFVYKQALLAEAERLARAQVLRQKDDIFYLTFQELHDVVRTRRVDDQLVSRRKDAFRSHEALAPPRVLTSDGEVVNGAYRRENLPAGALVGLAVSAGTVEGRARVILDMAGADLEPGDILVTRFTDPSWTPLFISLAGLVTEVGGLMTHGSVIAREYGVPAVVGVERATRLIRDGQRIRVHGTDGYIEILSDPTPTDR